MDSIKIYGYKGTVKEFNDEIVEIWVDKFNFPNVEQFLFDTEATVVFGWLVRKRTNTWVPNNELLQHLSNLRKKAYDLRLG